MYSKYFTFIVYATTITASQKPYRYIAPTFSKEVPDVINCDLLFSGDSNEILKADSYNKQIGLLYYR